MSTWLGSGGQPAQPEAGLDVPVKAEFCSEKLNVLPRGIQVSTVEMVL